MRISDWSSEVCSSDLKELFELMVDAQGAAGLEETRWTRAWLSTRASTIGGGTSEIHRNKLAERVLGMPRDPWADDDAPPPQTTDEPVDLHPRADERTVGDECVLKCRSLWSEFQNTKPYTKRQR